MTKEASIASITCWYGPYPWYLPYFVHSCQYNPSVDFYIITDNIESIFNQPENLFIVHKSLQEIKNSLSMRLGFDVNIENPYKLCDFKPAYGFMFPEIVKDYDFWAQSDIDIVFGNIRNFITKDMTDYYDFISVRHDYTTGCFALYKNNQKMNTLFMKSKDYQKVFSDAEHHCFDECNFFWDDLTQGKSIFELDTRIESFTHLVKAGQRDGTLTAHFDFILMEGSTGRVTFDKGKIIYKKQFEAILYHLFWLKKIYKPTISITNIPEIYYFSPTRIYHTKRKKITKLSSN